VGLGCGGTYTIDNRCLASTNEDTADSDGLVCSIVNCRLLELEIAL
jgi:hypothetical protein